jgi:hypothetical protein
MAKKSLNEIQMIAKDLEGMYSSRNAMYTELENIFLCLWTEQPGDAHAKITISPDARNAILGAVRLMTATEPQWSVPFDESDPDARSASSSMEQGAKKIWKSAGRLHKKPIEKEAVLTALLYDEVHIAVIKTSDLAAGAAKEEQKRFDELAKRTPLMFEVMSPASCYPLFDIAGLKAHVSKRAMKVGELTSRYEKAAQQLEGLKASSEKTMWEYWDVTQHLVWIEGQSDALIDDDNPYNVIPISCQVIEGSSLFTKAGQESRQPFLYTVWKSGMWQRQNLGLTTYYTQLTKLLTNPQIVYKANEPGKQINVSFDVPGGVITIENNESLEPFNPDLITPEVVQGVTLADGKVQESTIYKQTLGEPLGGNAPYSMVALLSQAGRLPLVPYQLMLGWVIGDAMKIGLELVRGEDLKPFGMDKDLPELFEIDAKLDITLPQDARQNVQTALEATNKENPLVSKRFAQENWLNIGQSDKMTEEIWTEAFADAQQQIKLQEMMMQAQMKQQQMAMQAQAGAPGQPGGAPGQAAPQGQPGQGIPPEMQQQGQAAQPGLPMTEPQAPMGQEVTPAGQPLPGGMNG